MTNKREKVIEMADKNLVIMQEDPNVQELDPPTPLQNSEGGRMGLEQEGIKNRSASNRLGTSESLIQSSIKRFLIGSSVESAINEESMHSNPDWMAPHSKKETNREIKQVTAMADAHIEPMLSSNAENEAVNSDEHTEKVVIESGEKLLELLPGFHDWDGYETSSNRAMDGSVCNLETMPDDASGFNLSLNGSMNEAASLSGMKYTAEIEAEIRDLTLDRSVEDGILRRLIRLILSNLEESVELSQGEIMDKYYCLIREIRNYSPWDLMGACESELLSILDEAGVDWTVIDRDLEINIGSYNDARGLWLQLIAMMRLNRNIEFTEDHVNSILEMFKILEESDTGSDIYAPDLTPASSSSDNESQALSDSQGDSGLDGNVNEQTDNMVIELANTVPKYVWLGDGVVGELLPHLDELNIERWRLVRVLSGPELDDLDLEMVERASSGENERESDYNADSGWSTSTCSSEPSSAGMFNNAMEVYCDDALVEQSVNLTFIGENGLPPVVAQPIPLAPIMDLKNSPQVTGDIDSVSKNMGSCSDTELEANLEVALMVDQCTALVEAPNGGSELLGEANSIDGTMAGLVTKLVSMSKVDAGNGVQNEVASVSNNLDGLIDACIGQKCTDIDAISAKNEALGSSTSICDDLGVLVPMTKCSRQDFGGAGQDNSKCEITKESYVELDIQPKEEEDKKKQVLLAQSLSSGESQDKGAENIMGGTVASMGEKIRDLMACGFSSLESSLVKQLDKLENNIGTSLGSEVLDSFEGMQGLQEYFDVPSCTGGAVSTVGDLAMLPSGYKKESRKSTGLPPGGQIEK